LLCFFAPTIAYANPITLKLSNGDLINADLLDQTDEQVTISHPVLGQIDIPKTKILSLNILNAEQPIDPEPVIAEVTEATIEEPDDKGLFATGFLSGWERRFDVGVTGSSGKSSNQQINLGFTADVENEETRISHKTSYYRAKSDGDLTDSTFNSKINRDWLKPDSPWFLFAGGGFDFDEFKDWDYRVNGNGGLGYEFYNNETFLLVGRSGLGFNQTFGGEREEFTPEGLLGIEGRWTISEFQEIKFGNTLYPNLSDTGEYRNLTNFDWILDLNQFAGVALKLGLTNEYDSETEEGIDKNDFKYTISLSWTL
jgi:hypothetical protein